LKDNNEVKRKEGAKFLPIILRGTTATVALLAELFVAGSVAVVTSERLSFWLQGWV